MSEKNEIVIKINKDVIRIIYYILNGILTIFSGICLMAHLPSSIKVVFSLKLAIILVIISLLSNLFIMLSYIYYRYDSMENPTKRLKELGYK